MTNIEEVNLSYKGIGTRKEGADSTLPPIIFLHGMTSAKETWTEELLRDIADGTGRAVFTYDARNHGDSGWSKNFDHEYLVKDLSNIIKLLQLPRVILVGHSMGGKTALRFALAKPDMVEKLVIEDMTPKHSSVGSRKEIIFYIELLKNSLQSMPSDIKDLKDAQDFVASYIQEKLHQAKRLNASSLPLKQDESDKFVWKTNLAVVEEALLHGFSRSPEMHGVYGRPALFLCGGKSSYKVLDDKEYILKLFPKAVFSCIEDGGHLLHEEYPRIFCEEVKKIINTS